MPDLPPKHDVTGVVSVKLPCVAAGTVVGAAVVGGAVVSGDVGSGDVVPAAATSRVETLGADESGAVGSSDDVGGGAVAEAAEELRQVVRRFVDVLSEDARLPSADELNDAVGGADRRERRRAAFAEADTLTAAAFGVLPRDLRRIDEM